MRTRTIFSGFPNQWSPYPNEPFYPGDLFIPVFGPHSFDLWKKGFEKAYEPFFMKMGFFVSGITTEKSSFPMIENSPNTFVSEFYFRFSENENEVMEHIIYQGMLDAYYNTNNYLKNELFHFLIVSGDQYFDWAFAYNSLVAEKFQYLFKKVS